VSRYQFSAEVFLHQGGSWHFLALPELVSDDIEAAFGDVALRVVV
jgi:hypothetical protein